MFVDKVRVTFKAGDGGHGILSFRRELYVDKGGPDGGDGGNGGDIVVVASRNQNTLANFRYKKQLKAENGQAGGRAKRHGKNGGGLAVPVPVGTVIVSKDGEIIADLTAEGQTVIVARGGKGGFGNAHFVSSTRQAPRVAEKGEPGEELEADMELKMIADIGLVGLPNAGKSTLLSVISNAKPAIADYPFTTLVPNLGVVDIDKKHSLLVADIPGLIEGASEGKGLGDEFLRHVERTNLLVHLVDIYNDNIAEAYKTIIKELKEYKVDLSGKPQIVAVTKTENADKAYLSKQLKALKKAVPKGTEIMAISSASREGIDELLRAALANVSQLRKTHARKNAKSKLPVIGIRPDTDSWAVEKSGARFYVKGPKIERFARRTKFGDFYGEQRLRDIMHKMGIMHELEKQGIEAENEIIFGDPKIGSLLY